jgi:hypothetical protein
VAIHLPRSGMLRRFETSQTIGATTTWRHAPNTSTSATMDSITTNILHVMNEDEASTIVTIFREQIWISRASASNLSGWRTDTIDDNTHHDCLRVIEGDGSSNTQFLVSQASALA